MAAHSPGLAPNRPAFTLRLPYFPLVLAEPKQDAPPWKGPLNPMRLPAWLHADWSPSRIGSVGLPRKAFRYLAALESLDVRS